MLERGLEEPPFANQPLVLSPNALLSCSTQGSKGHAPETPEIASQQSKRWWVHNESERSYELIQNDESVVEEISAVAIEERPYELIQNDKSVVEEISAVVIEERSYEPSQTEESFVGEIDAAVIGEKHQDDLSEILDEQSQTNNAIEPTAFGKLNTELDEYEQSRRIEINENLRHYQNTKNLPMIEDQ